jgi:type 2 lantibiotic biosynthesis protein LanM
MSAQLRDFAVSAATIDERLSSDYEPVPNLKTDTEAATRRLAAWCQSASGGDWNLFAKRLRRDGLTMEKIMPRLAAVRLAAAAPLPLWVEDAAWIVPAMLGEGIAGYAISLQAAGPSQPFESLFFGSVAEAERRRDAMLPAGALARVEDGVRWSIAHELLTDAAKLCGMAIYENFAVCRKEWQKEPGPATSDTTRYYDRFLGEMRRAGLRRLFDTKPVLLRLLASVVRQWIDTSAEFLRRLDADVETVRLALLGRNTMSPVCSLSSGLSDPHNFGRSVYVVRFADGGAVVYKPKDLTVDTHWAALIAWLNARKPPIDLRAVRVTSCDGYGWCEFIEHADCADRAMAERFFRRAGALLCLSHLVAGSDMHEENVIATGEDPIAIDLEMMFQATDPGAATGAPAMRALETAQKRLTDSVLTTGLLPAFLMTPETAMVAIGGLNDGKTGKPREIAWAPINTDAMTPADGPFQANDPDNLPMLDGAKLKLADYIDEMGETCAAYFQFIRGLKAELLAADGPINAFAKVPIRRVLKPTQFYFLLLERVRNHRDMRDGALWSAHLDFVARLADWDKESEGVWPLFAAERRALADLNIPFFVHAADSDGVRDGAGTGAGTGAASGLEPGLAVARRRIAALDETDIAWQLDVLRLTAITESIRAPAATAARQPDDTKPLDHDMALTWADHIAGRVTACALRDGESAAWIGLDPLADGGGWGLVALGADLYGGATGVALFLAAHARLRDHAASADLAQAALTAVRYAIRGSGGMRFARVLGIGGAAGIGSIVYALTIIAGLLDDDKLRDDAHYAARLLTDDVIGGDKIYDVIGGAAGCILGLLKLHRETGDAYALDRAVACGHHLLRSRPKNDKTGLWRHLTKKPLAGMSHGAAGIGYALAALAKASGDESFAAAARECYAYECSLFSAGRGNWPDLREDDKGPSWPVQWCHGAGGIGLARLGLIRFGDLGIDLTSDIGTAVATVQRAWPSSIDTLCCGNLGNVELLVEAGRTLGRDELVAQASARVRSIVDAAGKSGAFRWNAGKDSENLGFYRGLSGVGYTLLRQLAPETLPNVLIWE